MQPEVKNNIGLISSMIDESFDPQKNGPYQLTLQVSADRILMAVSEKRKNKFVAFENYSLRQNYNLGSVSASLDELAKTSRIFKNSYDNVRCIIVNSLSTFVPEAVYESERKKLYLKFNATLEGDEFVIAEDAVTLDAKNVFAIPLSLKAKLDYSFRNISYHHHSTPLIDQLMRLSKNTGGKKVFVHIQSSHFEVVVTEGKKLLFYNTFSHHSPEDFIYYLLFVYEQLQLNPEQTEAVLLGEIEKNSAIYVILQKYIRSISFGQRPADADFSYQLQSIPAHFYFTLFNSL